MNTAKDILQIVLSWPTVAFVALIMLRNPLIELIHRLGKAKIGPVEIELGKLAEQGQQAVDKLNRINYLMAESRLLELEITDGMFRTIFTEEQTGKMKSQIEELRKLTKDI